jgi:Spy/CpxP family protein refolding chaperone
MQRSKQQALMFLLGAVLVGGVLGFSAEHVLNRDEQHSWAPREKMYDDLGLAPQQRAAMDSVLDISNRQRDSILRPIKPRLDSVRVNTRTQLYQIFTPEQRGKFEARLREDSLRREKNRQAREQNKR